MDGFYLVSVRWREGCDAEAGLVAVMCLCDWRGIRSPSWDSMWAASFWGVPCNHLLFQDRSYIWSLLQGRPVGGSLFLVGSLWLQSSPDLHICCCIISFLSNNLWTRKYCRLGPYESSLATECCLAATVSIGDITVIFPSATLSNTIPCWTAHKNCCSLLSSSLPPFSALPSPLPNSGSCPYYPTETRVTKVTKSLTFQPLVYTTEHSCHLEPFFIHNTIILHDLIPPHLPSTSVSLKSLFPTNYGCSPKSVPGSALSFR